MILRVYRTIRQQTRSVWQAELVVEIEVNRYPEDPQAFADEYDGDFIEVDLESLDQETPQQRITASPPRHTPEIR
jgi:hypothetical protein